jgi:3-methyl-2-oxobutanoate hydroxymethyltransferase
MPTMRDFSTYKGRERLVMLTAYDAITARIVAAGGVDIILVGDSLVNTSLGHANTLPVGISEMLERARAVRRGAPDAFVVFDMPFLSVTGHDRETILACGRPLCEAGCQAVKFEGGRDRAPLVRSLVSLGIPVMGHIGLLPQRINVYGTMAVQGREEAAAEILLEDGRALAEAGAFALVVECVPETLGQRLARDLPIPVIGIGAGRGLDGQVTVLADLLGLAPGPVPKHAKKYADLYGTAAAAVSCFAADVRSGAFPAETETFH